MKKSLFLLGVAAAVFSGCSNQEVMDVAEYANQPIEFTTFVDKTTRSGDVTSQNFQKFWVFAQNKGTGDQNWADAFTNVQVSKAGDNEWLPINTYYWEKNKEFRFAGYANGESQLNKSIVSYDAGSQSGGSTSGLLTFTAYSTDGKNDLVAAMGNESNYTWDGTASGEAPKVSMTFRHMLSKLTFTFKTKMANTYTVAVNNLRIESATTKSTGTYHKANEGTITWSTDQLSNTTGTYTFDNITDVTADAANEQGYFSQTCGTAVRYSADLRHVERPIHRSGKERCPRNDRTAGFQCHIELQSEQQRNQLAEEHMDSRVLLQLHGRAEDGRHQHRPERQAYQV